MASGCVGPGISTKVLTTVVLLLSSSRAGTSGASLGRVFPMSQFGSLPAVAVSQDGIPHILYPSLEDRLRHAWWEAGRWIDESVDPRLASIESGSIAVDGAGRLHIAYSAFPVDTEGSSALVYGVREEGGWTLTDITSVAPGNRRADIAMDSGGIPRILFVGDEKGSLWLAVPKGDSWEVPNIGLTARALSPHPDLAIDFDGDSHALFTFDGHLIYATDSSGSWQETAIAESPLLLADIVVDAAGRPHVLAGNEGTHAEDRIVHLWKGEAGWRSEEILPSGTPGRARYVGGLAMDSEGHLSVAFTEARYVLSNLHVFLKVAHFDGQEWREGKAVFKDRGVASSAALGPDGVLHVAVGATWLRHLAIARPDLEVAWGAFTAQAEEGELELTGRLAVRNLGACASRPVNLSIALSDDDDLDETDELVGKELRVGRLRKGGVRQIPIHILVPADSVGRRVLAILDPERRREDVDRPNNTAAVHISE